MKTNMQQGQALVPGLLVLAVAAIFGWYIMQNGRAAGTAVSNRVENRLQSIRECQNKAHILNEISLANIAILASLSQAANAFAEAAQWNFNATVTRPWWKRESDSEEMELDKKIFDALSERTTSALHTARSLTQQNREHAAELARKESLLFGTLTTESPKKSMCRAIAMAGVTPKNSGIIGFASPITTFIPTLQWRNCQLTSALGTSLDMSEEISAWPTGVSDFGILAIQSSNGINRLIGWMQSCSRTNNNEVIEALHPNIKIINKSCTNNFTEDCSERTTRAFLRPHWTAGRNANRDKGIAQ